MREIRAWLVLLAHGVTLLRTGQLRFRLETFGLYYPSLPYRSPLWRFSPRVALLLLRRSRSYAHWLLEMKELRSGPEGWWLRQRGGR